MRLLPILLVLLTTGCGWIRPRSNFERDPFVMSHLTNDSDDRYARRDESSPALLASRHRAHRGEMTTHPARGPASQQHSPDFSWIVGELSKNPRGGWRIDYDPTADDEYGGSILLESSPSLGLVREGDRVLVRGEVLAAASSTPRYRLRSVARVDDRAVR